MQNLNNIFRISLVLSISASCLAQEDIQLFDGKTLAGWEGSEDVFRVENGSIVGGSLNKGLEESFYLSTTEEYSDFAWTLSVKLIQKDLTGNSGISIRAQRVPGRCFKIPWTWLVSCSYSESTRKKTNRKNIKTQWLEWDSSIGSWKENWNKGQWYYHY